MGTGNMAARSADELLGPAFELAPVPMSITGEDGLYWRVNAAYCRLLGYTRDELEGRSIADMASPELPRDFVLSMHRRFLHGEDNLPFYWRIQCRNGALRDVYLDTHRFADSTGRRFRITHLRDITGEREVSERRQFIEYAVDNCQELVIWTDNRGGFVYTNDMACRRLGYDRETLLAMAVFDIDVGIVGEGEVSFEDIFSYMRANGAIEVETRFCAADGTTFPVEIKATYVTFGGQEYNCAFIRDISRRKQAEQELARQTELAQTASRAKSNFLASMSHELRTPLNAIVGFADVIERQTQGPLQPALYLDYVRDIRNAGQHLLTHINNLLDLSRSASGHYRILPEFISLVPEIETARRLARVQHPDGAEIRLAPGSEAAQIHADPVALRRILLNLFDNALKFAPSNRPIWVTLARTGTQPDYVALTVSDEGPGIPADQLEAVMEPFVQAGNAYRRDQAGAGIGLALARDLARQHGGELKLASTVDQGTDVLLTLPVDGPQDPQEGRST